ncbi:MAG: FAD-binding protein, partial [Cyclobacteriaceae bacterium]|nr:FAD-binding protein [Cyclobacteriaceae bacterium]
NVFFLSTNAMGSNVSAGWKIHKKGAFFANPCFTQIHPTCIPQHGDQQSKLTLMSESLRNDGRIWVPAKKEDSEAIRAGKKKPTDIAEEDRDYYLERRYPSFGNLVPRDVASRAAKERTDAGFGVGTNETGEAVYLDFSSAIMRYGREDANIHGHHDASDAEIKERGIRVIESKYGNLFQMYEKISADNPYKTPMKIFPAVHYTMGGVWVDYNLMTTIPGCYCIGEANFSDHGANRLGASALMQGLADGYFVLPYTIGDYLADDIRTGAIPTDSTEFEEAEKSVKDKMDFFVNNKGSKSVDHFHKRLGKVMWNKVGMERSAEGLKEAIKEIQDIRKEFWKDITVPGSAESLNQELEKAGRVADFLELGELFARDALEREESCGGHFRSEHQTEEGEAVRDDKNFAYAAAWEFKGEPSEAVMHKEELKYENIELKTRSYK